MLKPDQVPKEAIEAAAVMLSNGKTTAQAIAAALNAWPGMSTGPNIYGRQDAVMHLPLPQEGE